MDRAVSRTKDIKHKNVISTETWQTSQESYGFVTNRTEVSNKGCTQYEPDANMITLEASQLKCVMRRFTPKTREAPKELSDPIPTVQLQTFPEGGKPTRIWGANPGV
jgi:hypothetical protein